MDSYYRQDEDGGERSGNRLAEVGAALPIITALITAITALIEALGRLLPSRYGRRNGYSHGYGDKRHHTQPRLGSSGLKLALMLLALGLGGWMLPVAAQRIAATLIVVAVGSWVGRYAPPLGRGLKAVGLVATIIAITTLFI